MIVFSWNMLYENKELQNAFNFIQETTFDIFCLQEVPEDFLTSLKTLPYYCAYVCEVELSTKLRTIKTYSVTLSKYPIVNQEEIICDDIPYPFRTKMTRYLLGFLQDERVKGVTNRKAFFADVKVDGESVRIFNLHLPLSHPTQRIKELERAMQKNELGERIIICGDFNILETFYISILNWLLGGRISDWFLYRHERRNIELYFKKLGFFNPLRNKVTHPLSQSQLDHILVPRNSTVISSKVMTKRLGSDHQPICVEVKL